MGFAVKMSPYFYPFHISTTHTSARAHVHACTHALSPFRQGRKRSSAKEKIFDIRVALKMELMVNFAACTSKERVNYLQGLLGLRSHLGRVVKHSANLRLCCCISWRSDFFLPFFHFENNLFTPKIKMSVHCFCLEMQYSIWKLLSFFMMGIPSIILMYFSMVCG